MLECSGIGELAVMHNAVFVCHAPQVFISTSSTWVMPRRCLFSGVSIGPYALAHKIDNARHTQLSKVTQRKAVPLTLGAVGGSKRLQSNLGLLTQLTDTVSDVASRGGTWTDRGAWSIT